MRARRHCKVNVYSKSLANLQTQVSEYYENFSVFLKPKTFLIDFLYSSPGEIFFTSMKVSFSWRTPLQVAPIGVLTKYLLAALFIFSY